MSAANKPTTATTTSLRCVSFRPWLDVDANVLNDGVAVKRIQPSLVDCSSPVSRSRSSLLPADAAAGAVNAEEVGNDAVVVSDEDALRRDRAGRTAGCGAVNRDMAGDLVARVGE